MHSGQPTTDHWPPDPFRAVNMSEHSENRIHSDEAARKAGFPGAIVGGVMVYGRMTRPLVARFGHDWLAHRTLEVTFLKPAYNGELLTGRVVPVPGAGSGNALRATAHNAAGVEVVRLDTDLPVPFPAPDVRAAIPASDWAGEREDIVEVGIALDEPMPPLRWNPTYEENLAWCDAVGDDLPIYREGPNPPLHPGLVLRQGMNVIKERYVCRAAVHAQSRVIVHGLLRVGQRFEIRSIPIESWQRKGNLWVKLYQVLLADGEPKAEIYKTSILSFQGNG